MEQIDFLPSGC